MAKLDSPEDKADSQGTFSFLVGKQGDCPLTFFIASSLPEVRKGVVQCINGVEDQLLTAIEKQISS
jgi:hypothetical protein